MPLQIGDPPVMRKPGGFALFALGFRPFFLAAGVSALVFLGLWLALWRGVVPAGGYFALVEWHAHEMLFGYTAAVIAGFLLTAVKNWTGMAVPTGRWLAVIFAIWLLGRLLVLVPGVPGWLVAAVDLAFIPLVGWALWRPLWYGRNKANRMFLLIFSGMTLANLLMHLDVAGVVPGLWFRGAYLMMDMVLLVLLLVAGRVVPFFTDKAVMGARSVVRPWVEKAAFTSMVAVAAAELAFPLGPAAGTVLLAAALIQGIRLAGWYSNGIWRVPILWVLHIGYAWLVLGLALRGLAGFGLLPSAIALHAITVGGIGVLTLGMMARVALGHTGRNINDTGPLLPAAFVLLNIGAILRVFGPLFAAEQFNLWVDIAGGLWMLAFAAFVLVYTPILISPRVDGRPG